MKTSISKSQKNLHKVWICLFVASLVAFFTTIAQADAVEEVKADRAEVYKLIEQGYLLAYQGKLVDARAKWTEAMHLSPKDYLPRMVLSNYYLQEVNHYELAKKHGLKALDFFTAEKGDKSSLYDMISSVHHRTILTTLADAELNLDNYQKSLDILATVKQLYPESYDGSHSAWVLMKLGKVDDAISVIEEVVANTEGTAHSYNILGILLSLGARKKEAIEAFIDSMKFAKRDGYPMMVATQMNNSGEVYREIFREDLAEASWKEAARLPDSCTHILPYVNLSIHLIDSLRLYEASEVLRGFVACHEKNPVKTDADHSDLLALFNGRIELYKGEVEAALPLLEDAAIREQSFGTIGTSKEDFALAANLTLAEGMEAANNLEFRLYHESLSDSFQQQINNRMRAIRKDWALKRAKEIAIDALDDFEDLKIRHTDAMVQYTTLGRILNDLPTRGVINRLERLIETDPREGARNYYHLYQATVLSQSSPDKSQTILKNLLSRWSASDALAKAESLALMYLNSRSTHPWFSDPDKKTMQFEDRTLTTLYNLNPATFLVRDLKIPVRVKEVSKDSLGEEVYDHLMKYIFYKSTFKGSPELSVVTNNVEGGDLWLNLTLSSNQATISTNSTTSTNPDDENSKEKLVNRFIREVFTHRKDRPRLPLPRLPYTPLRR